ncbi:MAG: hypothetical protein KKA64_00235 [Nanoarchaeota archaeon]|nr:hypothetical protein [Nanoarchaeota archaeon]
MKIDENLAAVHAYLCADGYVTTNNKWKYYRAGLRNTNLILLEDFQERFEKVFGSKPTIRKDRRCEKCSKEIYEKLTEKFGSFYSWEWRMPKLNLKLSRIWLRAYFDCEGWVFCKKRQNRHIGVDCVNEIGLNQVIDALNRLGIKSVKKFNAKRKIYRILIYSKENLQRFKDKVGFLHPEKNKKLNEVLEDFVVYEWDFPKNVKKCKKFVFNLLKDKTRIKKPRYARIISREEVNLKRLQKLLKEFFDVESNYHKSVNGIGTIYYELNINRKEEVKKLIKLGLIPNLFK